MSTTPQSQKTIYLKDYTVPDFNIQSINLTVTLADGLTTVESVLEVKRNPKSGHLEAPLVLNGEALVLKSIMLDGSDVAEEQYELTDSHLTIPEVPDSFSLKTVVEIVPEKNTTLSGLYRSNGLFCTQCEPEGFRRITYYIDRPDVMALFKTTLIADKTSCPILLSNGNCIDRQDLAGNQHKATFEDPFPKPSYLFAMVAGDLTGVFDSYTTAEGREVALEFYVEAPYAAQCGQAIESLKNSMRWDEETYGLSYDLDAYQVVAVSDFNMGAMENKGLNVFNTKYVLADPQTATDLDYQNVEAVIGHEYFHNWTGNRVTCRDWFQLSLKEGLTVFREQQFSAAMGAGAVKRIQDVSLLRDRQFPEDAGPMAHAIQPRSFIEINNFYTMTIYNKGAEVIRMQHTLLGEAGFRKGIDRYFEKHDGQAVTTNDFVAAMEEASGVDLSQFDSWYTQSGTPHVSIEGSYDASEKRYTLSCTQSCIDTPDFEGTKKPFIIPIRYQLLSEAGDPIKATPPAGGQEGLLVLTKEKASFCFESVDEPVVPAFLEGFSAPVTLSYPYTPEALGCLVAFARDPFVRWDAGQQLLKNTLKKLRLLKEQNKPLLFDAGIFDHFMQCVECEEVEPAFAAEMLKLPSLSSLLLNDTSVNVDSLLAAYDTFEKQWVRHFAVYAQKMYQRFASKSENTAAERALKNQCLSLWVATGEAEAIDACVKQYENAQNMTDRMGALSALNERNTPERASCLSAFYEKWKTNPLVMDKWFALQARSGNEFVLDQVKSLTEHQDFTYKNPNRVYALLSSFANTNVVGFHQADGAGYAFIRAAIETIDPMNPQVAARLAGSLTHAQCVDKMRQVKIIYELKRLLSVEGLSSDVYELVHKSLKATER